MKAQEGQKQNKYTTTYYEPHNNSRLATKIHSGFFQQAIKARVLL